MDTLADDVGDGALDVDLAELSLGQRLAATTEGASALAAHRSSGSDQEQEPTSTTGKKKRNVRATNGQFAVPANSLARTLIQALHSSDTQLLEACLIHSDDVLIRNTVQRLPQQLAIPLLTACVDRLGRGARSNTMKGRGGGASAQRGMGLIAWVKAVLTMHSAHLMTVRSSPKRVSISASIYYFSDARPRRPPG